MKTIWKFPVERVNRQDLFAPAGRVISAGLDPNGALCVWGTVDLDEQNPSRIEIAVCGTGHRLPEHPFEFIGTVNDGPFMWHVFANHRAGETP